MSKAARGTKRVCKSCGARFYDLDRDHIVCPACQATFEAEKPSPVVEAVVEPKEAPQAVVPEAEPDPPAAKKSTADEPEFISLEEAEAETVAGAGAGDDADLPEIEDGVADLADGEEIASDEDDNTFLEPEDEDETDVSGIIGAPIKPGEEV